MSSACFQLRKLRSCAENTNENIPRALLLEQKKKDEQYTNDGYFCTVAWHGTQRLGFSCLKYTIFAVGTAMTMRNDIIHIISACLVYNGGDKLKYFYMA